MAPHAIFRHRATTADAATLLANRTRQACGRRQRRASARINGSAWAGEAGAHLVTHTPVTAINTAGRVTAPAGDILADNIVCAAGPWSRDVASMGRPRPGEGRTAWFTRVAQQLGTLYPALDGIGLYRGWSGAFDATPDNTTLIGAHPVRPFLWAADSPARACARPPRPVKSSAT
ncbi:hypothetical protein ACWCXH_11055 [Kitasatospora sp. NPDC001660]